MTAQQERILNAEIKKSLEYLLDPKQIVEVRIPNAQNSHGYSKTLTGYFNNHGKLTNEIERIENAYEKIEGFYFTPNPVIPQLLARAENQIIVSNLATKDNEIVIRRYFLIDIDPERPRGTSSTNLQHEKALKMADEIALYLGDKGWPAPVMADSGNGAHLMYKINIEADNSELIANALQTLNINFTSDDVKVDTSVYNRARIWKLYGTMARKGSDTAECPHRMAHILWDKSPAPRKQQIVKKELLEKLAQPFNDAKPEECVVTSGRFKLESWLKKHCDKLNLHSLKPAKTSKDGAEIWALKTCPFFSDHAGSAYIYKYSNGALGFKCFGDRCKDYHWEDFREKIEPGCKTRVDKKGLNEEEIDYSQPLNKILLGVVSSVEQGRVAFEWFEKNGGRFYKDKEHNCYLFYKDNIYRIDSNRPFKSLILKTANISENTIGGKVIFDAMANLAFEKGNKMESCSWQYTDVINHKVYISLNNDKNELIQISSAGIEVIKNGNNENSIFLQGSNKILPINYTELDDAGWREAFRKIKELIFDNLACAPADRYLYLSWVLAFPLIGYLRTIPHMRLEGSSGSGKSRGMELISYLIYGESALKCATVASNYTDGALNPLILLDNIESRNLSSALEDFIITAVTGISKEKRSIGTNKENIRESVKTLINSSGIESLNKNELINRTLIIDFDRVSYGNANYSELVYGEIIRHRDIMLSGVFQLIKHVYAGLLSGELEKVKVDISKKHPGHSKDRADNYLAIMKMIAGKLIEHFKDSFTVDCLFESWINGQDSHAQTTSADTNPILQYLSSLVIEFSRYNHIKEDYEVRGSSGLLDCRWQFSGTASHFFATFTKLAKKMGLPMEYKSAGVLAKRFKDSRKILEAAGWVFTENQLRSRIVEYKFKYSPKESGEDGEAEKTDSPPVSPKIRLNAVGS